VDLRSGGGLGEDTIVKLCIESDVGKQAVGPFGGAPGFSDEAVDVGGCSK
jgi:hypothetical protein